MLPLVVKTEVMTIVVRIVVTSAGEVVFVDITELLAGELVMGRNGRVVTVNVDKSREFDREVGVTNEDKVVDDGVEGAAEVIVGGEIEKDVVVDDDVAGDEDEVEADVSDREEVIAEDEKVTVEEVTETDEKVEDEGTVVLDDDDKAGEEIEETD
ncbi:hypothetical protein PHLCEN_2v5182 [Hermanssonia centrifuga]|uniref:Uncharacterized protein n=1 Tax=Hermanssonia centrifuga TaxID=98765 RepID=A0A2R6P8S2_9APHY|nr:hypothetical protein PHLCEN_2v5182 [Hermanssonia centrifuga]